MTETLLFGLKSQLPFFFILSFFFFWQRIEETERFNSKMKARIAMKRKKNWKMKKNRYSMRVSATSEWCLLRIAQNRTKYEKYYTDSIREFQHQGCGLYFSKWVEGNIVSHPEYHMTVMCSNRSDNLGFLLQTLECFPGGWVISTQLLPQASRYDRGVKQK